MAGEKGRRVSSGAGNWSPESMQAILLNIYENSAKIIAGILSVQLSKRQAEEAAPKKRKKQKVLTNVQSYLLSEVFESLLGLSDLPLLGFQFRHQQFGVLRSQEPPHCRLELRSTRPAPRLGLPSHKFTPLELLNHRRRRPIRESHLATKLLPCLAHRARSQVICLPGPAHMNSNFPPPPLAALASLEASPFASSLLRGARGVWGQGTAACAHSERRKGGDSVAEYSEKKSKLWHKISRFILPQL
jgi:hypothetical protein